jgi:hypothetical protein
MIRIPAPVKERHDIANQQPKLRRQPAASTVIEFGGSPAPVAAAPAGEPAARNAKPRIVVGVAGSPASVVRHIPDPIALGRRTHLSGRKALAGAGFR